MMALEQDGVTALCNYSPSTSLNGSKSSRRISGDINRGTHHEANRAISPCSKEPRHPTIGDGDHSSHLSVLHGSLRPITLKFEDVTYSITLSSSMHTKTTTTTRTILNGVTGVVRPGEIMAMLGPSGSGKTTLLTALSGRLNTKFTGTITYNNHHYSSWVKRKTGFVTQDDILYPHLTVLETLTYAALLRLPRQLSKQAKIEQAEMVIHELGLSTCRDSVIGGPLLRGVSGGERKRVSIGQEMLVNPSLLLLDEPTSGLDSTTALRIVATLRRLAKGGRTVVMTIHQPSSRLYRMFDMVVVLCDGSPIYSGRTDCVMGYFESVGLGPGFDLVNPADFLLDLASGITSEVKQLEDPRSEQQHHTAPHDQDQDDDSYSTKQHLISSYKKNLYPVLKSEIHKTSKNSNLAPPIQGGGDHENEWTSTWWEQFKVLLKRGLKERRHESYSALRVFQVISVSILSGLLWWKSHISHLQDQVGLLFFFSIFWGFFPLFNSVFAFPQERPMLIRERSSGMYRLSSYYFARTVGDLPMELVLPTIFTTITYWMGGLKPSPLTFLLTLIVILFNVLVAQGLGLALGAILMDVKQATTLASVVLLVFLLAGGYYIQHINGFVAWIKYLSFSHYCYKLLIGVQYDETQVYACQGGLSFCRVMDFPVIKDLGIGNLGYDVAALAIMLLGYRVLAYLALRFGPYSR